MELLLGIGVGFVNYYMPEPYMDEEFHARQTDAFYQMQFGYWDEKLTTFPGTFVITSILRHVIYISGLSEPITQYRAFNCFFSMALYWLLRKQTDGWTASYILCIPPLFMSCFLYYTDVLALLSVVWVWYLVRNERYFWSGIFAALAICVRQTNIIWVGYSVLVSMVQQDEDLVGCVQRNLLEITTVIKRFYLHLFVLGGFLYWVVQNGGIVVGDQANHIPLLHLAQINYLNLALLFFLPIQLKPSMNYLSLFAWLCFAWIAVNWFTHIHQFLLSDNRHYTFYLWKDFLGPFSLLLVPVYAIAGEYVHSYGTQSLRYLIWLMCASLQLIPAGLLEPRYFLPAMVFFLVENDVRPTKLRVILFLGVNLVLLWVFAKAPYKDIHFMWQFKKPK